ncbi:MAG: hypothetical protein H0W51_06605 [Euzebyales bacterium]|nr:hypothetical protein [Euzebyales bacterium]
MNESDPLLDRELLGQAFAALGQRLERHNVRADIYVFGGAAMILAYGVDRATRDVDAVFNPDGPVLEAAAEVAEALALPRWWLNSQASVYLSTAEDGDAPPVFDHPFLRVQAASPRHLVAMKALAARAQDREDLHVLIDHLGLTSPQEVFAIVQEVFPEERLSARKQLMIEDVFLARE